MDLSAFAEEVGSTGTVVPVGGRTQWDVGGPADPSAREVRAPVGVVQHEPAEMTVRCGAGTTVAALDAVLAEHGQMVALDAAVPERATVGGVLAVGHSGVRRLRYGPVRDVLLEARYVSAEGRLVKCGGPTVKNVSGFDLCRLLVGSLGTVGVIGEVVLRARPRAAVARWLSGDADPFALRARLHQPSAVLWDGIKTWLLLEGHAADVDEQAARSGLADVDGPPPLPTGGRWSLRPSQLRALPGLLDVEPGRFVAEIGVGIVHTEETPSERRPDRTDLHERVKRAFDPTGRLNPGRVP